MRDEDCESWFTRLGKLWKKLLFVIVFQPHSTSFDILLLFFLPTMLEVPTVFSVELSKVRELHHFDFSCAFLYLAIYRGL